jgi:signal transduction histidine kinase
MTLAGGAICIIVVLLARRITKPLAQLAEAAEHAGRGDAIAPLAEDGPIDVRQTIRAFNRMNDRLQRFVRDRTQMLAAISHDLRTPLTSAQLRAELIEDEEKRADALASSTRDGR